MMRNGGKLFPFFCACFFGRASYYQTTKRRKIQEYPGMFRRTIIYFLLKHLPSKNLDLWIYYVTRIFTHVSDEDDLLYDAQKITECG